MRCCSAGKSWSQIESNRGAQQSWLPRRSHARQPGASSLARSATRSCWVWRAAYDARRVKREVATLEMRFEITPPCLLWPELVAVEIGA
jgi:hypothetical protein